jgi:hypothetical protein
MLSRQFELAGLSFEAMAAAVLHCYYSDLQPDDKLWQYLSTTKEKLMAEHTHQNLATIDGQQILPAVFLELELNCYFCPWEYSKSSLSSTDSEMALQPDTTETNPYLEDIETPIPPQQQPPKPKLDPIFERLMVFVARKLTTLVPAMFMETASAMDEHKRKKRAENQTASVVKKTATVNMGTKIAQALAKEPPVSRATMASFIDERIKQHEKQSAKNIVAEARKNSSGGGGNKSESSKQHTKHTWAKAKQLIKRSNNLLEKTALQLSTTLATPKPTTAKYLPISATCRLIPSTQLPAVPAPNPTTLPLYPLDTTAVISRERKRSRTRTPTGKRTRTRILWWFQQRLSKRKQKSLVTFLTKMDQHMEKSKNRPRTQHSTNRI